jgi:hypothetical protein
MDDHVRLLRLASLVVWAGDGAAGLRFVDEEQEQQWRAIPGGRLRR